MAVHDISVRRLNPYRVRWFESAVGHALTFTISLVSGIWYNISNESEPRFRKLLTQTVTVTSSIVSSGTAMREI